MPVLRSMVLLIAVFAAPVSGQGGLEVGIDAAAVHPGRFLDQFIDGSGERELRGEVGPAGGLHVWWRGSEQWASRLGVTVSTGVLEFVDDTGDGARELDQEVARLSAATFSGEISGSLGSARGRFAPFFATGPTVTLWYLDPGLDVFAAGARGDRRVVWRLGWGGGLGIRWKVLTRLAVKAEGGANWVGNPFDGPISYRASPAPHLDEPERILTTSIAIGVIWQVLTLPEAN